MPHETPLIATIVIGLALAFVFGTLANRLKISPLVGYLLAGVAVGPFTPGFVADQNLANELAEIGVILLMFGVGLHFSLKDLMAVKAIAIPGAVVQIAVATLLGMGLASLMGWSMGGGIVFGLSLSVASTVVLLRALQERRLVESERGRIAVGWLIVEDIAMVLTLVLLPPLAGLLGAAGSEGVANWSDILIAIGITIGKVGLFLVVMLVIGRRFIPWLLHYVAHLGSRELFRLAVLAIALGVAYASASLFGVSFALGAFFAGMILSESPLSQRAAEETLPLRDAFAVLFFISVGMLFDPTVLLRSPLPVLAVFLIIVLGKSVAAFVIVRLFRHPTETALTISASLAQIGEFSFILATLGVSLKLLNTDARDLILAGAILSILFNPFAFVLLDKFGPLLTSGLKLKPKREEEVAAAKPDAAPLPMSTLTDHAIIVGYGRVGSLVGEGLRRAGKPYLVIEEDNQLLKRLAERNIETIRGNAAQMDVLHAANLVQARWLFLAIPNGFEAGQVVEQAHRANENIEIVARAHTDAEVDYLRQHGANFVIMGEREIARGMIEHVLGETSPASF